MSEERRTHWLRTSEANRFPRRLVTLDAESDVTFNTRSERHRFKCAVAAADVIDKDSGELVRSAWCETTEPGELWQFVDGWTRSNGRTIVAAHNLGFDLRVTDALHELPALGWELRALSLDSYRCWARWRKGNRGLSMIDTASFYPAKLEVLGRLVGLHKRPLPDRTASLEAWLARCRRDVEITREVVLQLLEWLEVNGMGSFKLTGPAQASSAFRARFLNGKQLLVHDHSPALEQERLSAYTGRCEAWRHGPQRGWLYEWDERLSYAHWAERLEVPTRLVGHKYEIPLGELPRIREHYALLCEVEIETETPVAPTRHEGRIVWPVGRFSSTLWDLEVDLLELYGAKLKIRHAFLYERAPALKPWATWIIDQLDGPDSELDPLQRIMVKSWSRSLIGRFGLRYPLLEHVATAPTSTVSYLPQRDGDTGELRYTLQIGREVKELAGAVEGRDSMPAIMAYVMAAARRGLWAIMQAVGLENVAYVDTDSLLVNRAGHERLLERTEGGTIGNLRYKRRLGRVEIIAPRMLTTSGEVKIAGLPRDARRTGARTWQAEYWESAKTALARGRADEVVIERRNYSVKATDRRRRHRAGGLTIPYRIDTLER